MRTISQPRRQESQLHIVKETSQELTLQLGNIPKGIILKKARTSMLLGLVTVIPVIGLVSVLIISFVNTKRDIPIPPSTFYPFYFFFLIFIITLIIFITQGLYSPRYTFWTLNHSRQKIIKNTTNLLGKTRTYIFPTSEVKSIQVEEHLDPPQALTELYMVLKSGKQLTLSVSSYTHKESEKAINLEYHQLLAEKMRRYAGL